MNKKLTVYDTERKLQEYLSYTLKHMGLEKFKTQISVDHTSFNQRFNIHFVLPVEVEPFRIQEHDGIVDAIKTDVIDPWIKSLQESDAVLQATEESNNRITKLEQEKTELTSNVNRLKQFENHFDLEMKLRHGDKNE